MQRGEGSPWNFLLGFIWCWWQGLLEGKGPTLFVEFQFDRMSRKQKMNWQKNVQPSFWSSSAKLKKRDFENCSWRQRLNKSEMKPGKYNLLFCSHAGGILDGFFSPFEERGATETDSTIWFFSRKAEEDRIRKEEEKARRELIKQEYLRRKQQQILEEQGLGKPKSKPKKPRPKSVHREESYSDSGTKCSSTRKQ